MYKYKEFLVCLCFSKDDCEERTREIAKRNNANDWFIEGIVAPLTHQLAYRGFIVKEVA